MLLAEQVRAEDVAANEGLGQVQVDDGVPVRFVECSRFTGTCWIGTDRTTNGVADAVDQDVQATHLVECRFGQVLHGLYAGAVGSPAKPLSPCFCLDFLGYTRCVLLTESSHA